MEAMTWCSELHIALPFHCSSINVEFVSLFQLVITFSPKLLYLREQRKKPNSVSLCNFYLVFGEKDLYTIIALKNCCITVVN